MNMRLLFISIIALFCAIASDAQRFDIERVLHDPMDITAKHAKRVDLNGVPCALVKFEIASPNAKFEGNIIGAVEFDVSEYLVYVSKDTKEIRVKHPDLLPTSIYFPDYGINGLLSGETYVVTLSIASAANDKIDSDENKYLYAFQDPNTGYIGFKNPLGEVVVKPQYEDFAYIRNPNLIVVVKNSKVGIISPQGKPLFPCQYDYGICPLRNYVILAKNDIYGIKNYSDEELVPFVYTSQPDLFQSVLIVEKDGKYGLLDSKNLNVVLDCKYECIRAGEILYDNGILRVDNPYPSSLLAYMDNGKWGFIDQKGKIVIPAKYEDDEDYRVYMFINGYSRVKLNDKYGLIDETGKVIIPIEFVDLLLDFDNLSSCYYQARDSRGYRLYRKGEPVTDWYAEIPEVNDDMCVFKKDGKMGLYDMQTKKEVVRPVYDEIRYLSEDYARFIKDGKYGYLNRNGKEIFKAEFDDGEPFCYGFCAVKKDGKWGFLKASGTYSTFVDCKYDRVFSFGKDRLARVYKDGKWGCINALGKLVTPCIYDSIDDIAVDQEDFYAHNVQQGDKEGWIDGNGALIVPCEYSQKESLGMLYKYMRENNIPLKGFEIY